MLGLSTLLQSLTKLCRLLFQFSVDIIDIMGESKRRKVSPVRGRENGPRTRFYSEGSQRGASANEGARDLPDLVSPGNFRDRANSAPTRPSRSATEAGRELRRISDEFMMDFQVTRGRRNSFLTRFFDSLLSRRDQGPQRSQEAAEEEEDDSRPNAIGAGSGI